MYTSMVHMTYLIIEWMALGKIECIPYLILHYVFMSIIDQIIELHKAYS